MKKCPVVVGRPAARPHGALQLVLVDLEAGQLSLSALDSEWLVLPPAMRRQQPSQPHELRRRIAHIALRAILASQVGLDIARQPFVVGGAGKPRLAQSGDPIEFSFAHSESHALVALSADGPVGIDIEAARAVRISPDRRALLEAAAEALAPVPLPSGPADRRFLQAWVRLEAVAKLTGEGISALLGRLGVRSRSAAGPSSREFSDVAARSIVRDLAAGLPPQLHAAVAVPCGSRGLAGETPLVTSLPLDAGSLEALVTCRS